MRSCPKGNIRQAHSLRNCREQQMRFDIRSEFFIRSWTFPASKNIFDLKKKPSIGDDPNKVAFLLRVSEGTEAIIPVQNSSFKQIFNRLYFRCK